MWYQKRRQEASVAGSGWLRSQAARPPGPSTAVSKRAKWPGNERGRGAPRPSASDPGGSLAGLGRLAWAGVSEVCARGCVWLWGPSPTQTHLPLCPGCGPQGAGGSGRARLHCSSPSCTRPGQARADGSSHTDQPQSHRKLQGTWAISGAAPIPGAPPLRGVEVRPGVLGEARSRYHQEPSRSQGQATGSHLAEGRARPAGAGHPARRRSAPRRRPRPQTPPGRAQGGGARVWSALDGPWG